MSKAGSKQTEIELHDALKMTFPASDPVSVGGDDNTKLRIDRQPASLDGRLVERLSREVKSRSSRKPH